MFEADVRAYRGKRSAKPGIKNGHAVHCGSSKDDMARAARDSTEALR